MSRFYQLKNYEGLYLINKNGIVKNSNGDIIKPFINEDNYKRITLFKDGKKRNHYIHILVCNQFIPQIKGKKYVNHTDLNRQNNKVNNLEWVSHKENCQRRGQRTH